MSAYTLNWRHILACQVAGVQASRFLEWPQIHLLRPWELNVRHCLISLGVEATAALGQLRRQAGRDVVRILSRVTRWPSGWNVDRQKRDDDDQDRIKRDLRDVETPTSPLLYSLLVHVRSPSVGNRPTHLRTISVPPNG